MLAKVLDPVGRLYAVVFEKPEMELQSVPPEPYRALMRLVLTQALGQLTAGQRGVLTMRFGLGEDSLAGEVGDVAREMGVGIEIVRRHEHNGLARLRMGTLRELLESGLLVVIA